MHLQLRFPPNTIYRKKRSFLFIYQGCRSIIVNPIKLPSAFRPAVGLDTSDSIAVRKVIYPPFLTKEEDNYMFSQTEDKILKTALEQAYAVVTPANLIRFALLGDQACRKDSTYSLDTIYLMRHINFLDSNKEKIRKLTHNFRSNLSVGNMHVCEILSKIALGTDKNKYLNSSQLSHIISLISSTKKGCSVLALPKVDEILTRAIHNTEVNSMNWKFRPNKPFSLEKGKNFYMTINCNNLGLNMISRGITPGSCLAGRNLRTAANRMQLESLQMYLDIIKNKDSINYSSARRALSALARHIIQLQDPLKCVGMLEPERAEILKRSLQILTGWEKNGVPRTLEVRKNSFGSLVQAESTKDFFSCRSFFTTYICVLADLGLIHTLKHEWVSLSSSPRTCYNTYLFTVAFLVAKKPHIALSTLQSLFEHNRPESNTEAGIITFLEMSQRVGRVPHISQIFLNLYAHYRMKTTINLRNQLGNIELLNSPHEILGILVQYIPPRPAIKHTISVDQGSHYLPSNPLFKTSREEHLFIEWTRGVLGEVGLLVSSKFGERPLYWRPISLSRRQLYHALDT